MSIFKQCRRAERTARAGTTIGRRWVHGLVAVTAVAGVAAFGAADAVPALANNPIHTGPSLTLSNGTGAPGQWAASGNTYARGLSDVEI